MSDEKDFSDAPENTEISTEAKEIVAAKTNCDDAENTSRILRENRRVSETLSDEQAKREMIKYSRRRFLVGGAAAALGAFGYWWLRKPEQTYLFTDAFRFNEKLSQLYYSPNHLAPEFPPEKITEARVNGVIGMESNLNPAEWNLRVGGLANHADDLVLTFDDIKQLPRVEMTTELKCIEGWSIIVHWAGARFSDFVQKYQPRFTKYVSLATPDNQYFVGWDMPSILHPQTLLAYEINGSPLPPEHGAPLRLASPLKYGIKQIKRIGRIEFTDERPRDYWAESGYDWYSGH